MSTPTNIRVATAAGTQILVIYVRASLIEITVDETCFGSNQKDRLQVSINKQMIHDLSSSVQIPEEGILSVRTAASVQIVQAMNCSLSGLEIIINENCFGKSNCLKVTVNGVPVECHQQKILLPLTGISVN
jgi:hypothetical protein